MKGESINLSNIEKKVKEDFEKVKEKLNEIDYEELKRKGKTGANEIANGLEKSIRLILSVAGKIIGGLIVFIAGIGLFSTFSALLGISIVDGFELSAMHMVDTSGFIFDIPIWAQSLLFIVLSCIPLWLFLLVGLKLLNPKGFKISKTNLIGSLIIWGIAIVVIVILSIGISGKHNMSYEKTGVNDIAIQGDTLQLQMDFPVNYVESVAFSKEFELRQNEKGDDILFGRNIEIQLRKNKDSLPMLRIHKKGFSRSWENAKSIVEQLNYNWKSTENEIIFDSHFENESRYMEDEMKVKVDVYIPENFVFSLEEDLMQFLNKKQKFQIKSTDGKYLGFQGNSIKCLNCEE